MANVSITTRCNRDCVYCFSRQSLRSQQPGTVHMPSEGFDRVLAFLSRSRIRDIRLLGGEPTLHPEFESFIDKSLDRGLTVCVFSNGLIKEAHLRYLELQHPDKVSLLINTIVPDALNLEAVTRQRAALKRLGPLASLGINLYSPGIDPGFLVDMIKELGLNRFIRVGIAHPCVELTNQYLHPRHYQTVGKRLINLVKASADAGIKVELDCGFVPCMFEEEAQDHILKLFPDIGQRCNPILDILPDGDVVSCFPLSGILRLPVTPDTVESDLQHQFTQSFSGFRQLGIYPECSVCRIKASGRCSGGCLSAAMIRLNQIPESVSVQERKSIEKPSGSQGETHNEKKRHDSNIWSIPYIDQKLSFWEEISSRFISHISEVYFPLPGVDIGSGRPEQPNDNLDRFLLKSVLPKAALINPVLLKRPVGEISKAVIDAIRRIYEDHGVSRVTVSDPKLATRIKEALPHISITGSVLMDISSPNQALMLSDTLQTLVPASRIMRNTSALENLNQAFAGRIRLMVNESCLPNCPYRVQHFYEMGLLEHPWPQSLCNDILTTHPWMRLTGSFVLPQHLDFFNGLYDELKLAGRVTLNNPDKYIRVLNAYINREPMTPDEIGGGPASMLAPVEVDESFYRQTLTCGHQCHSCAICKDYYSKNKSRRFSEKPARAANFRRIHTELPIFHVHSDDKNFLYSPPGLATAVTSGDAAMIEKSYGRNGEISKNNPIAAIAAHQMLRHGKIATQKKEEWLSAPFKPECLTIYPSSRCQLSCRYCYSRDKLNRDHGRDNRYSGFPDDETLIAASKIVAQNCAARQIPFHLVLHGGGEPTHHFDRVKHVYSATRDIAAQFGIDWFGYIATNGVLTDHKIDWLARHFDQIGLSCDGPPDIQDRFRPMKNGAPSSGYLENTAARLKALGKNINIRATITASSMERQVEIVSYLKSNLDADTISFEPVYRYFDDHNNGHGPSGSFKEVFPQQIMKESNEVASFFHTKRFRPEDADVFFRHFSAAGKKAEKLGISLSLSGIRLDEIHGPYCDILRNVLRLTPCGTAAACFLDMNEKNSAEPIFQIGRLNKKDGTFIFDDEGISELKSKFAQTPDKCFNCINVMHCAGSCPDVCSLSALSDTGKKEPSSDTFQCRLYKQLAVEFIKDIAVHQQEHTPIKIGRDDSIFDYIQDIPLSVDLDEIIKQYDAVQKKYSFHKHTMPPPVWHAYGFEHKGEIMLEKLRQSVQRRSESGSLSIYVHIPFCNQNCGFCDCYSFRFKTHQPEREQRFVMALLDEIKFWVQTGGIAERPVTTVHFGGGTPNSLSPRHFSTILNQCKEHFNIAPETELAIETTSSLIDQNCLDMFKEHGITRLHVGVQTLDDALRKRLGRRLESRKVIRRIARSLEMGFITTVDLIYGLPGQTLGDFANTIRKLTDIQTSGFSLYQLNVSKRNQGFVNRMGGVSQSRHFDYLQLQTADQMLTAQGYVKSYYNHYAGPGDRNLYFTYPHRDEDLLALGPTADGVFGDFIYRHSGYGRYMKNMGKNASSFEGGMTKPPSEKITAPVSLELLRGGISNEVIRQSGIETLVETWIEHRFLVERTDGFLLTANGTWFIHEMLEDVSAFFHK